MGKKEIGCIICALMISVIFLTEIPNEVSAQVTEEWVARYNGPGNDNDQAHAIALDSSGNVYVTGESWDGGTGDDYTTVAYDSSGNELWVAGYNGLGNDDDYAYDIAVDSLGNVYVTGMSYGGIGTYDDYATLAYDSSGNELWVARYNGPGNSSDRAHAIAIDSVGNVYVTGESYGGSGIYVDYATLAYDSSGNELWVARYNGPGNDNDIAHTIAIDLSGNVYVTGYSFGSGTSWDYATIKYDSSGNEQWVRRYNGPADGWDVAYAIAVSSSGNVYVTGYSAGVGTDRDITTVSYDSSGNELWVERYNGPGNGYDEPYDIAFNESSGNVYVTGISEGLGTGKDYATLAYDSTGNELWAARYNGPLGNGYDEARAIALDPNGNIYVTGFSNGVGTNVDYATVAYDSSGNEQWVARYNSPANLWDSARDIAVDTLANVYVTGFSYGNGTELDYCTIKYSHGKPNPQAIIDIDPNTLNLKSKGRWITCYITLNSPFYVVNIDISTILLEDTISTEWGDIQNDTLMVKFDRSEVEDLIGSPAEEVTLTVSGEFTDGTEFSGSDTIRVINPP